jgi:DNA-binding GntR family transcriptional regulator
VEDAFELRGMLEAHAAMRACLRMAPDALAQLKLCNAKIQAAISLTIPDIGEFVEANREFHSIILAQAQSPRLAALLGALIEQPVVRRTAEQYGSEQLRRSCRDHDELIAAFERRDGVWAQSLMLGHIRRAFHVYADAHKGVSTVGRESDREFCIQNGASVNLERRSASGATRRQQMAEGS